MVTKQFVETMKETATTYDAIAHELFGVAHGFETNPRYQAGNKMTSLVRSAEESTIKLRNLTSRVYEGGADHFYEEVTSAMAITIMEEKNWIVINVPAILPKRNARDNTLYITRPLRNCLVRFQREQPMERFRECMICIVHYYDEALGARRVRDYDNIETKRYLDVIESILLTNDSGLLCSVLQTTELSDQDLTQFYIMLPESLPMWAKEHIKTHT